MTEVLSEELANAAQRLATVRAELAKVIRGQDAVIEQVLVTLLCGGHALLEGVQGVAKTLTIRTLGAAVDCRVKRIQFTPDLMPSDIIGTNVFDLSTSSFRLHGGPIFTDLLLADEINRAPAKTQAALLEAMSERHATIDGVRYELSPIFTVFATQNPIEFEGTYQLPEAQQDRFLLKITVPYPSLAAERDVVEAVHRGQPPDRLEPGTVIPVLNTETMRQIQAGLPRVRVEPAVIDYVVNLVRATREHDSVLVGASPRGSIFLLSAAKARALLNGRDFVTPDDVVAMVNPVLAHRMTLTAEAEIAGLTRAEVLRAILSKIEVPTVIIPGRRTILAAGILAIILVAAVIDPVVALLVVIADLALVGICFMEGRRLKRAPIEVQAEESRRVQVGRKEAFGYRITNRSNRHLVVCVRQPWPAGIEAVQNTFEVSVAPREMVDVALTATPRVRGTIEIPGYQVDVRTSADWARWRSTSDKGRELKVFPSLRGMTEYEALRRQRASGYSGLHRQRMLGAGREFDQLREYCADDDYRDINWKATARRNRPITNIYQAERSRDVLICLDCGRMMGNPVGDRTALDHAIDAAIMLAHVANRQGDRVGLALFRDVVHRFVKPAAGMIAVHRIIEELVDAKPQGAFPSYSALITSLRAYQNRRSLVLIFTDLNDPQLAANLAEVLPLASQRHVPVVISLRDPLLDLIAAGPANDRRDVYQVLAANQLVKERATRSLELQQRGASVLEADAGSLTVKLLNTYLSIKARQLI